MTDSEFDNGAPGEPAGGAALPASGPMLPMGLSEEEAARLSRPLDLPSLKAAANRRFFWTALWKNIFSVLNLDLFTIAIIMFLLGSPWSTFGTALILTINVSLNVLQEVRTKKRLGSMIESVRAMTTVIRDGHLRSIDSVNIVPGDVVVVAPGDLIPVDGMMIGEGELVVEEPSQSESVHAQGGNQIVRTRGDLLRGGSYCLKGHAVYQAQNAGADRATELLREEVQVLYEEKTPLQRLMSRVFMVLGIILAIFAATLLVDGLLADFDVLADKLIADEYRTWLSILFGIAPTSMLFIFVVQYAVGSQRIADAGALVPRIQSLERLASVSALCFSRQSLVSGLGVSVELAPTPAGHEPLSYRLVRRILGDLVHSATSNTGFVARLRDELPGDRRRPVQEKPLLRERDWYGASFADPDMRGTFVVGERELLEPNLVRSGPSDQTESPVPAESENRRLAQTGQALRSWAAGLLIARGETGGSERRPASDGGGVVLAYSPDIIGLFLESGQPILPKRLVELARLDLTPEVRPELARVTRELLGAGVELRVLAAREGDNGPEDGRGSPPSLLRLGEGGESLLDEVLSMRFHDLDPDASVAAVQRLRDDHLYVAVVGTGTRDLPAMLQADVAVTLRGSSPALLEHADAVLMDDSLRSLPRVMRAGQRVVNGLIDTLKLNLTPVSYQFLLIILLAFIGLEHYPFHPNEGALISVFALIIPNILITWWAQTGRLSSREMGMDLLRFIAPAAVATAILAAGVYLWVFSRTGDRDYSRVSVTWALLVAAWLRVFLVEPPSRRWVGASKLNNDKRIYWLVALAVVLFGVALLVPLARQEFRIFLLHSPGDYGVVALCVFGWYVALLTLWRFIWPLNDGKR